MADRAVSAFISYSWDSEEHKQRVLGLAQLLRLLGLDVRLDQFEEQKSNLPAWMAGQIREADHVIVVGSPRYKELAEAGVQPTGFGVQWEAMLITHHVYHRNNVERFVPVYMPPTSRSNVLPDYLMDALNYEVDIPVDWRTRTGLDPYQLLDTVAGLESLYRRLTDQPAVIPMPVGQVIELEPTPEPIAVHTAAKPTQELDTSAALPMQKPPVLPSRGGNTSVFENFGLIDIFDARSVRIREQYQGRTDRARHSLDIMGFGLRAFREDFQHLIPDLTQRLQIRLLVVDPGPVNGKRLDIPERRDDEEGNRPGAIRQDVTDLVQALRAPAAASAGRLQVRLYRCLPMVNVYRVDDELFWGPYLIEQQSRNSPTFLVQRGGILWDRITAHFNSIWSSNVWSRDAFQSPIDQGEVGPAAARE